MAVNKSRKEITSLNLMKGIGALLVVLHHTSLPGIAGDLINMIARTLLALFFFISGYFMFTDKEEAYRTRAKKKALYITKLTVIVYIFYVLFEVFVLITGSGMDAAIDWIYGLFHITPWLEFFIFQFDMIAGPYWYLNSMIVCYLAVLIFKGKMFTRGAACLAFVLLGIHCFLLNGLSVFAGIELPMILCRNAWFYGLPFFILGGYQHKLGMDREHTINKGKFIIYTCLSAIFLVMEFYAVGYRQLYIGNIFLLYAVVIWALQNKEKSYRNILVFIGRELSLYTYIVHWAVMFFAIKFLKIIHLPDTGFLMSLLTVAGTLVTAWIIWFIRRKLEKGECA